MNCNTNANFSVPNKPSLGLPKTKEFNLVEQQRQTNYKLILDSILKLKDTML